jgi:N-acetylornithine carbamoyltransferase
MFRFLNLADLPTPDVHSLLLRAAELRHGGPVDKARGLLLGMLFLNPSLRTRVSMAGAWTHLGGGCVDLTPGQGMWKLATGTAPMLGEEAEHIEEAAGVLGRLCNVLGVRAFASGKLWEEDFQDSLLATFAKHAECPLINMESALWHPCQALADWLTLDDHGIGEDRHFVLSWAWHPKALPMAVPNSALLMAAQRGMRVTVLRPEGYALDGRVMDRAKALAAMGGGSVEESDDPDVIGTADVVYAKSWGSIACYGDLGAEMTLREPFRDWCVGNDTLRVNADARLMHCLPVRRDVVVTRDLLTSKQSLILDEAENRKWAQAAVLEAALR